MALIYVTENFIDENSTLTSLSEHALLVRENLYNERPSLPYRTTGVGSVGNPEWICADIVTAKHVNFCGIFNHNLTALAGVNDELELYGCETDCDTDCSAAMDLTTMPANACGDVCSGSQPIADFLNLYHKVSYNPAYRYWRLEIIDANNSDGYLQIGEWVLAEWQFFQRGSMTNADNWVRLSPGRPDGPMFFMGNQRTHYGQDWTNYRSDAEHFTLTFTNTNDPCIVDELHAFLRDVMIAGGRFILVPDDTKPFCYYVIVDNLADFANRLIYGDIKEFREWSIDLKTLSQGITFISS